MSTRRSRHQPTTESVRCAAPGGAESAARWRDDRHLVEPVPARNSPMPPLRWMPSRQPTCDATPECTDKCRCRLVNCTWCRGSERQCHLAITDELTHEINGDHGVVYGVHLEGWQPASMIAGPCELMERRCVITSRCAEERPSWALTRSGLYRDRACPRMSALPWYDARRPRRCRRKSTAGDNPRQVLSRRHRLGAAGHLVIGSPRWSPCARYRWAGVVRQPSPGGDRCLLQRGQPWH